VTQFVADPGQGGVFQQSFLQQLVSIHFPGGVLIRVSFTGSGANSISKPKIMFPFDTLTTPVLNYVRSFTGVTVPVTDPPTPAMIKNLYAWSILNDEGNFVYYNTSLVQSKFKKYTPVVINSPPFIGIAPFTTTRIIVWYYGIATSPTGPFDPIVFSQGGGWLASFDTAAPSVYTPAQINNFINQVVGGATMGTGGIPFIPVGDGGTLAKGTALVNALATGSHLALLSPGGNVYVATSISSSTEQQNAGWGLQASMFSIKGGVFNPVALANISDFAFALSVPALTITLTADAVKHTLKETKS